jgi:LysR family transcriptional regulator, regulator for metE and metH
MTLSLRHLRLVQEVARAGTLTAAAKRLYLTQSALSHQLADLERQAGAPVFTRVGKRMVLTQAGHRILEVAGSTLDQLTQLEDELRGLAAGTRGQIRLTTQCNTAYHWLPSVLPQFQRKHEGIEFRIVPECSARVLEAVLNGEVDVALSYDEGDLAEFDAVPLFEDEQVLIVSPDHKLAQRTIVSAEDFRELDLLVYRDVPQDSLLFQRVLIPNQVTPRRVTEVRITEAIVALVAAGVGASVITRWSVAPEIRAGRVVPLQVTEFGLRRCWQAVMLKRPEQPQFLQDFIALLQKGPNWIFDERAQVKNRPHTGIKAHA